MENKVKRLINKYNLINKGDKIVVGVSGGPDSMCLLYILNDLKDELGFKLCVAHVNHMIRKEADEETEYVKDYCKKIGVECFVEKVDVIQKSKAEKIGTEEAGRKARYDFFETVLQNVGANKIATAHNANDNAETVLMNIFRGTGISGLKGIEPIRDGKYIRPIIECERYEIEAFCDEKNLQPKIDKSNFDNVYTRNKIRNIIIPEIKQQCNPNVIQALNKLSNVAKQENNFIDKYVESVMKNELIVNTQKESITENYNNCLILNLNKFNSLDYYIKTKVVLSSIQKVLGNTQSIEKIHIDDIIKMCQKNVGNKHLTPNKNIMVSVNKGKITFQKILGNS